MLSQRAKQKRKFLSLNIIILLVLLNLSLSFAEEVKFIYPPYDDSWGDADGRLYPIHSLNGYYHDENKNTGEMFCMAYATGDAFGSADAWAVSNIYKDLIVDHNGKYVNHTGKYNITAHFHIQGSITACHFDIDSLAYSDAYIKLNFWIYDLTTESYISQKEKIVKEINGITCTKPDISPVPEHFFNIDQDIDIPINNINLIQGHSYQLIGGLEIYSRAYVTGVGIARAAVVVAQDSIEQIGCCQGKDSINGYAKLEYIKIDDLTPPIIIDVLEMDKSTYYTGNSATLSVSLQDRSGNPLQGANVSYNIKADNNVIVKSGTCSDKVNGNYQSTFSVDELGNTGTFKVEVTASKTDYIDASGITNFDVVNLSAGHNLRLKLFYTSQINYEPGTTASFDLQISNIGDFSEDVTATLVITGPDGNLEPIVEYRGTIEPAHSTGTFTMYWSIPSDAKHGSYGIEAKATSPSGDEDFTDNKKSLVIGVFENNGGIKNTAYIYTNKVLSWDPNYQIPGCNNLGGRHATWDAPNGHQYKIEIGAWSETNDGTRKLAMNVYKDGNALSTCYQNDPPTCWVKTNNGSYYDAYDFMVFNYDEYDEPNGNKAFILSMAVPVSDSSIKLEPTENSVKLGSTIEFQAKLPNQTYDYPEVWKCNSNDQPNIMNNQVLNYFSCPNSPYGSFIISATPTSINDGSKFALVADGYVLFARLLVEHSYDAEVSKITIDPTSPRSGAIVTITSTIENIGSAPLTGIEVSTSITGPNGYNKTFNITTDGGDVQFFWDTLGCSAGNYIITTTISLSKDSNDSNNAFSKTVYIGPPPYLIVTPSTDKSSYCVNESVNLSIIVKDDNGLLIAGANAIYSVVKDSSVLLSGTAGDLGNGSYSASFNDPSIPDNYKIKVQADYPKYVSGAAEINLSVIDCTSPSITIFSPNGGETLLSGSTHNIKWSAYDNIEISHIKIEYSIDGGASYSSIIDTTPNTGSYPWIIPNTPSSNCKVKVIAFDSGGNTNSDESDNDFSIITSGQLQVLINPQEAIDAGAQWRLADETTWHNSEETISYIPGDYSLEFKPISGWSKPLDKQFTIKAGITIFGTGTYERIVFVTDKDIVEVLEGGEVTFLVKLSAKPSSDVTVTVGRVNGDEDIRVKGGAELTFAPDNWDMYQTVTLDVAEDDDAENGEATIKISAVHIPDKDVTAKEQDNDELLFVTDKDEVIVPEGGEAEFQLKLTAKPSSDVSVTVSSVSGDEDLSVKGSSELMFTPDKWDTWQTVMLEAAEDDDAVNGEATIRISASDIPVKEIIVREADNDKLEFETDKDKVDVPEEGEGEFQVKLTAKPSSDVSVKVEKVSGDEDITVKSGSDLIIFSPENDDWKTFKTVILEAAEDDDAVNGEATIRISASDIPSKEIIASEGDNDKLEFETDKDKVDVPEGGEGEFQVRITAKPSSDVSVKVEKVSGDEDISVKSGSDLTFSPENDDWKTFKTVTFEAAKDDDAENGEAIIRISAPDIPYKNITAKEQDNSQVLYVDPLSWTVPPEGGESQNFEVSNSGFGSEFSYEVSESVDWLSLSSTGGTSPGLFAITATPNDTGSTRMSDVVVTASGVIGSPQNITVEQEAIPPSPDWEPVEGMKNNMIVYGVAYNEGELALEEDWIGAFGPGGEPDCRAVGRIAADGLYYLTVRSNASSGENIIFKLWPLPSGPALNSQESVEFIADELYQDKELHFGDFVTQDIDLVKGWNWISLNIFPEDTSFDSVFASIVDYIEQVKTQTQSAIRTGGDWIGDLPDMSGISEGLMYKIKTSSACTLSLTGTIIDSNRLIFLVENWSWIAYLPQECKDTASVVSSVTDNMNQLKSQTQAVVKVEDNLIGDLQEMCPDLGYTIKMDEESTLVYAGEVSGTALGFKKKSITKADTPPWEPITGNEYNMIAYGHVYKDGALIETSGYYLGSFGPGGESDCRSVGEVGSDGFYFATIRGNTSGEAISFKIYESSTGEVHDIQDTLIFQSDDLRADFDLHFRTIPEISLSLSSLNFGATTTGEKTEDQQFLISNIGGGTLDWSIEDNSDWLSCSPASGTGDAVINVSVDPSGLSVDTYTDTIAVSSISASNSPQIINATLIVTGPATTYPPFGSFDTPEDGATGITGAMPLAGWALDDIGVDRVEIWRDPVGDEPTHGNGLVYIGDAILVEGARPDIEQEHPDYPLNYQAGWGYMLLTNCLPNHGSVTCTFYAIAYDKEGHRADLGVKTITSDNSSATKPFGTIDTPTQGGEASEIDFVNFGWALTEEPNYIPYDGSTITVWIDGEEVGNPVYNQYRSDVAELFPGYANSDGAVGYFYIDTTKYVNGVHTIAWNVVDNGGNSDDIGIRYFTVINTDTTGVLSTGTGSRKVNLAPISMENTHSLPTRFEPLKVTKGFRTDADSKIAKVDSYGVVNVDIKEVERVKFDLGKGSGYKGYLIVGEERRCLPVGSTLNAENGTFSWQPGPGFIGNYDFVFIKENDYGITTKIMVRIRIRPKSIIR